MAFVDGTWLDLGGAAFLLRFVALGALALVAAMALRRWLPRQWDARPVAPPTVYETAFLVGGAQRAYQAVLSTLRQRDLIDSDGRILHHDDDQPWTAVPLDDDFEVHALQGASLGPTAKEFGNGMGDAIHRLARGLVAKGYLLDEMRSSQLRTAMLAPGLAWAGLGVAKLLVGIARGRPVGLLVLALLLGGLAFFFIGRGPLPSTAGRRHVEDLRHRYPRDERYLLAADAVAGPMLVALYGLASLDDPLHRFFRPEDRHGGVGCGAGGDGGGGGGGCGGCGGCGG